MTDPWYAEGLEFACARCGNCCKGDPGSIRVDRTEVAALAARFELNTREFRRIYTRQAGRTIGTSLIEKPNGDCIFFDRAAGCVVYDLRPRQCRTWPFWKSVVASPGSWEAETERCAGMNDGPLVPSDEIERLAANDGTTAR